MTTWTVTLPGRPASVAPARAFTSRTLAGMPCAETAELCVSELAANAVAHTPSGLPGGTFTVTITATPGTVRLEVADAGTSTVMVPAQRPPLGAEHGRGLWLVARLAARCGFTPGLAWCEIVPQPATATATPGRAA